MKKERGITLIALVITIIVLLILAGVTINLVIGENGIIEGATGAKEIQKKAEVKEKIEIAILDMEAEEIKKGESLTIDKIVNGLPDKVENTTINKETDTTAKGNCDGVDFEVNGNKEVTIEGITGGGSTPEIPESSKIKVGDYVNYVPETVSEAELARLKSTFTEYSYVGLSEVIKSMKQDLSLKWRVFKVEKDTIELISENPTTVTNKVNLAGDEGYNNGVYLLNDYCKTFHSNPSKGAIARSIKIEDVQEMMDLSKGDYHDYTTSITKVKYGDSYTYQSSKDYPYQWTQEKTVNNKSKINGGPDIVQGVIGMSEQSSLTKEQYKNAGTSIEVEQTFWTLPTEQLQSNFKTADTRNTQEAENIYYEMLFNTESYYYLASRCSDTNNSGFATFGLYEIMAKKMLVQNLFDSKHATTITSSCVRPIVSIPINTINTSVDYNGSTGWELK